jgi:hypothetical protein
MNPQISQITQKEQKERTQEPMPLSVPRWTHTEAGAYQEALALNSASESLQYKPFIF